MNARLLLPVPVMSIILKEVNLLLDLKSSPHLNSFSLCLKLLLKFKELMKNSQKIGLLFKVLVKININLIKLELMPN